MNYAHSQKKDLSFPVQYVKGIGPRRAEALAEQGVKTVQDLLYYFPFDYLDLSKVEKIGNLKNFIDSDQWVTTIGRIASLKLTGRFKWQRFVVTLLDDSGTIDLVFFRSVNFFKGAFEEGEYLAASGKVTRFGSRLQMIHPSLDRISDSAEEGAHLHTSAIVPKYISSATMKDVNLNVKGFRRVIRSTLDEFLGLVSDHLPPYIIDKYGLLPLREALANIHFPADERALDQARKRLKFDELFCLQLMLAIKRKEVKVDSHGIKFNVGSRSARKLLDSLPFKLTRAQLRVLKEITADMATPKPMSRLIQGDVGSGKTVVALLSMLVAVDDGYQAAFMAPTEILAEQHYRTITGLLGESPVSVRLLLGGQAGKQRKEILAGVKDGAAQIVVGTHALIQEGVKFSNLGLIVIDEQHRFGVGQRISLREKGVESQKGIMHPDILIMTATPIPRTLSLTVYGDLDVSVIDELPRNRKQVKTVLRTESEMAGVYSFIREQVKRGGQVYIVYPLVEESTKLDLKAATEHYDKLKSELFTDLKVGLLHGQMNSGMKEEVMSSFKAGEIDILVATTVIEVGVDVPNASVMIIEHAERYGLSQLHQLRGRVGRGSDQSYCILITPDWVRPALGRQLPSRLLDGEGGEDDKITRRIRTMLETTDGFKIAENDLILRGPGDFFGTRQSGVPILRIANILADHDILSIARAEAFMIIEVDPDLRSDEHRRLKEYFTDQLKNRYKYLFGG